MYGLGLPLMSLPVPEWWSNHGGFNSQHVSAHGSPGEPGRCAKGPLLFDLGLFKATRAKRFRRDTDNLLQRDSKPSAQFRGLLRKGRWDQRLPR